MQQSPGFTALDWIRYSVDLWAAALLLTGKIQIVGIFVVTEGFYLAATGPILGGPTTRGTGLVPQAISESIHIITALLLICNAISVTGPYISSQRLTLVFSGPIFGIKEIVGTVAPPRSKTPVSEALADYIRSSILGG